MCFLVREKENYRYKLLIALLPFMLLTQISLIDLAITAGKKKSTDTFKAYQNATLLENASKIKCVTVNTYHAGMRSG